MCFQRAAYYFGDCTGMEEALSWSVLFWSCLLGEQDAEEMERAKELTDG